MCFDVQRDTIQAASGFAQRNQLPVRLQDQMISHLSLKFRTDSEGLQQQETLDALPKAIRSSISHYLFYNLVQKVYLFRGISCDLLFQLVRLCNFFCFPWLLSLIILSVFYIKIHEGFWDESWILSSEGGCNLAEWSTYRLLYTSLWQRGKSILFLRGLTVAVCLYT